MALGLRTWLAPATSDIRREANTHEGPLNKPSGQRGDYASPALVQSLARLKRYPKIVPDLHQPSRPFFGSSAMHLDPIQGPPVLPSLTTQSIHPTHSII